LELHFKLEISIVYNLLHCMLFWVEIGRYFAF
jgi:hypothetical protein